MTDNNGSYTLHNAGEGYAFIYVLSENPLGTVASKEMMFIKRSDTVLNTDFVVGKPAIISGRVIDRDTGEPIVFHPVGYHKRDPESTDPALCTTFTDESGMYRFSSAFGSVWIFTSAPAGYEDNGRVTQEITVKEGENITIEDFSFKTSKTMKGVLLTEDGKPVPDAVVIVTSKFNIGPRMLNMYADKNGTFTLSGFTEGKTISITAQHRGLKLRGNKTMEYIPEKIHNVESNSEIEIQPEEIELVLKKYETTAIKGKVVDFSGNPLPNATVCLGQQVQCFEGFSGIHAAHTLTDKNGNYSFDSLIIGDVYNVRSYKEGYATPSTVNRENSFDARKNMPQHSDLKMIGTDRYLEGNVTDNTGNPVTGAYVSVGFGGMSDRAMAMTDADGNYRLENLAEVVIRTLMIKHDNYGYYKFYDIPTNETHDFKLQKPLGSFSGRVVDSDNNPVEGGYVYIETNVTNISGHLIHDSGLIYESGKTDNQGTFHFKHILDKQLDLKAWHKDLGTKKFKNVDATAANEPVLVFDKADEPKPAQFTFDPNDMTLLEDNPAPKLEVDRWLHGEPVRLSEYKGKVVFLDFCDNDERSITETMRKLTAYNKEYGKDGVVFIAVIEPT